MKSRCPNETGNVGRPQVIVAGETPALTQHDTIVAPITGAAEAAVSIVRLSGKAAGAVARQLLARAEEVLNSPNKLLYTPIYDLLAPRGDDAEAAVLDQAMVVFFREPNSFTGEDVLEINLHGSPFLVQRLLENVLHSGARLAAPGEFTARAFHNGKLDLSQAEAVADLIAAQSEIQARLAREQLAGRLSQAVSDLGEPLRDLLAEIEAWIDFPDEDIEPGSQEHWKSVIGGVSRRVHEYVETFRSGRICREGANVVIAGAPNAGKSSLLNRLVGEERVIVTPIPGTTRDSIEEHITIAGLFLRLWDTAGLSAADGKHRPDEIEKIGIEQSWKRIAAADLVLYLFDAAKPEASQTAMREEILKRNQNVLVVANKVDLLEPQRAQALTNMQQQESIDAAMRHDVIRLSAKTGAGINELKTAVTARLLAPGATGAGQLLIANQRHYEALKRAGEVLGEALNELQREAAPEFISLNLRHALGALDEIIGVTTNEDVLGRIFSKFCIGK